MGRSQDGVREEGKRKYREEAEEGERKRAEYVREVGGAGLPGWGYEENF